MRSISNYALYKLLLLSDLEEDDVGACSFKPFKPSEFSENGRLPKQYLELQKNMSSENPRALRKNSKFANT